VLQLVPAFGGAGSTGTTTIAVAPVALAPGTPAPGTLSSHRRPPIPDPETQASLARRVHIGDAAAEETVVAVFHERVRLLALARTRVPEVAEEVAQDALVAVITALRAGQLRDGERLTAFVYGTARNYIRDYFRTSSRRPQPCPLEPNHAIVDGDPLEALERQALVRSALKTLKPTDRRVLLLTLVDGLKPGDIAKRLALSDEVVRARKSRALKKVIEYVQKLSRIDRS